MMKSYKVEFEARKVGAIGVFERFVEHVSAMNADQAKDQVANLCYSKGYEHFSYPVATEVQK